MSTTKSVRAAPGRQQRAHLHLRQAGPRAAKRVEDPAAVALLSRWHPAVGSAIAAGWQLAKNATEAIANQGAATHATDSDDTCALLVLAVKIAVHRAPGHHDPAMPDGDHLGLSATTLEAVLDESREFGGPLLAASDPRRISPRRIW